ncbi:MAG: four helix bundle protein [Candidatus Pacebacteria bacterium]|nr:four helix bundle protein [Candidatus Paceibacterota bacterium]
MTNNIKFDLEERTAKFGENIIIFCKNIPENYISKPVISQLIRSSTSIGANYSEADDAESKKDFIHKIGICKKESRETKHWLRMINTVFPDKRLDIKNLWQEAKELNLIFNAIINSSKKNKT